MLTCQIHHIFTPHAWSWLSVLYWLHSICSNMTTWKLNYAYRWQWNWALYFGHLLLATIVIIKHCEHLLTNAQLPCYLWSIQVVPNNTLVTFIIERLKWKPKNSFVFLEAIVKYSQSNLSCVEKCMLLIFCIFHYEKKEVFYDWVYNSILSCNEHLQFIIFLHPWVISDKLQDIQLTIYTINCNFIATPLWL
jgi:hypothetical protein